MDGNAATLEAFIRTAASTNSSVRRIVIPTLEASAGQNQSAAAALESLRNAR